MARTRGLVSACKEMHIEVCGNEIINIGYNDGVNNPGILNYGFQLGSGGSGVQTIPLSDFDLYFEVTNRVNCPVVRYELWGTSGGMYLPTDI